MILRSIALFFLLLAASMLEGCERRQPRTAVDGILDLRGMPSGEDRIELAGPWIFLPGKLVPPDSFETYRSRAAMATKTTLPSTWKDLSRLDPSLGDKRHASFLLDVRLDSVAGRRIRFSIPRSSSSYRIWVDGNVIDSNDTPGEDIGSETATRNRRIPAVLSPGTRHSILLQVSGYHLEMGDRISEVLLEDMTDLPAHRLGSDLRQAAIAGIMGFLAVHYLLFLTILLREKTYLYLGLFCLFWGLDCMFDGAGHPLTNLPDTPRSLLCVLFILGAVASLVHHVESKSPNRVFRTFNRIFLGYSVAVGVASILAPSNHDLNRILGIYLLSCPAPFAMISISTIRSVKMREPGSVLSAIGIFCLLIAWGHDALGILGIVPYRIIWGLYGGLGLAICESFAMGVRFSLTHRDNKRLLSEVQSKNREMARLSGLKDEFLANTSHELRTPLHGIHGLAQAMLSDDDAHLTPKTRRNLEHVVGSTRRLTRLVNDILDFAKIRHHDLAIRPSPLDVAIVLPTILPHFQAAATAKGVALHCDLEPDLPWVSADEDRLFQILFNLVGNAIKFTDWGEVRLGARRSGEGVEVSISDTGIGIEPGLQERIFEPFEQADGHFRGGTGLGLSITRKLVELHGGTLTVTSRPGEGSTFTFQLACAEPSTESSSAPTPSREIPHAEPRLPDPAVVDFPASTSTDSFDRWVLAIDDEPVNLLVLANLLNAQGIGVVTAPDGRRALEMIREHDPEVVLLDVMMPFKDGYEVCADIRARHSLADLPVLFLSARSRLEDVVHGFAAGGNDYVLKPFLGQELVARVQSQMRQREVFAALKENRSLKVELADLVMERDQIELVKNRLAGLFHGLDEPILVVDSQWTIRFANLAFARLASQAPEHLLERPLAPFLEPGVVLPTAPFQTTMEISLPGSGRPSPWRISAFPDQGEELWIVVQEIVEPDGSNPAVSRLLLQKLAQSESRLSQVRDQMDLLSKDLQMDLPLGEVQSTLSQIRHLVSKQPDDALKLTQASELLNETLELWTSVTGKSKADLAEESGLWAVHMDHNGWRRTVTLDKYLDPAKIPKLPKWKTIRKCVDFVVAATSSHPAAHELSQKALKVLP